METIEAQLDRIKEAREVATAALNHTTQSPPIDQYKEGDQVWLEATHLPLNVAAPKLAPRRQGPFEIIKQVSPVAYHLRLPPSWNIHNVFHALLLTPYKETDQKGANFTRPPAEIIEGEAEFEVEAIVSHRFFGRSKTLQYLIKWQGYPTCDNMWEPMDQVFSPQLIKQYHQKHPLESPATHKRRTVP